METHYFQQQWAVVCRSLVSGLHLALSTFIRFTLNLWKQMSYGSVIPYFIPTQRNNAFTIYLQRQALFLDTKKNVVVYSYKRTPRLEIISKKLIISLRSLEHPNCLQINCSWDSHLDIYETYTPMTTNHTSFHNDLS